MGFNSPMSTPDPVSHVVVCGPASWNHLISLDRFPEPVPHMQFAESAWHTVGGTSAGKAAHLAALGVPTVLHAPLGADEDGERIAALLIGAGVDLRAVRSERTERHVNLMARDGRVSLYVATPSAPSADDVSSATASALAADVAVLDLSELGLAVLRDLERSPRRPSIWTDLHDYDGAAAFHGPFLRAAEVVLMNADATDDAWALLASCVARGPRLAVCTLGAQGAIALEADGTRHEVAAVPAEVVDTNGAGDAFMAGLLAATLRGQSIPSALSAAAAQARVAIEGEHLHPALRAEG